jgi:PPE-SVP subfamily C-terminal region
VPPTWQGSTPARMVSAAMSGLEEMPAGAMAGAAQGGAGMMPMPMPMGAGAGGGMPGGIRGGASPNHVVTQRPSVVPRTGVG